MESSIGCGDEVVVVCVASKSDIVVVDVVRCDDGEVGGGKYACADIDSRRCCCRSLLLLEAAASAAAVEDEAKDVVVVPEDVNDDEVRGEDKVVAASVDGDC